MNTGKGAQFTVEGGAPTIGNNNPHTINGVAVEVAFTGITMAFNPHLCWGHDPVTMIIYPLITGTGLPTKP